MQSKALERTGAEALDHDVGPDDRVVRCPRVPHPVARSATTLCFPPFR